MQKILNYLQCIVGKLSLIRDSQCEVTKQRFRLK